MFKRMTENHYIKKELTELWLKDNSFRYNSDMSDADVKAYTKIFPVYQYGRVTLLECGLTIFSDNGEVRIDVFDSHSKDRYSPFYYESSVHNEFLRNIERNIKKELKKLGIVKYKRRDKYGKSSSKI